MNSKTLAQALYEGATLQSRYKPRRWGRAKYEFVLTYPDGKQSKIQRSTVDGAIKAGQIIVKDTWSGDKRNYALSDHARIMLDYAAEAERKRIEHDSEIEQAIVKAKEFEERSARRNEEREANAKRSAR